MNANTTIDNAAKTTVLEDIIVFQPKLRFFGGAATLTAADLGIKVDELPGDVVTLGTKSIVDSDILNYFKSTRKAIQRRAKERGASFLGGFAMSKDEAKLFLEDVNPKIEELNEKIQEFLDSYEDHVDAWATKHPQWEVKIREAAPSLATVRSRFEVSLPFLRVSPPDSDLGDNGLGEELEGLAGTVLQEIASDVFVTWKPRGVASQGIKGLLRRIFAKSKSLSFIDNDLSKLGDLVEKVLAEMPPTGPIEGHHYLMLKGLFDQLLQPAEFLKSLKSQAKLEIEIDDESAAETAAPAPAAPAAPAVAAPAAPAEAAPAAPAAPAEAAPAAEAPANYLF